MTNINAKKKMKIAMVGVSPADQIAFKGYLRVLLRLDVELDWVSAQVGEVDLYVINEDFKSSASVQKLVEVHPHTPVLYVSRNLAGDGSISGNSLVLPLKQINALNAWLYENVGILKGLPYHNPSTNTPIAAANSPTPQTDVSTAKQTLSQTAVQPKQAAFTETKPVHHGKLNDVIEMIQTLHDHPHALFELLQDSDVFAVIDGARRLVWATSTKEPNMDTWRLRVYGGTAKDDKQALNLNEWLYQIGQIHADTLLPLFDQEACYQMASWLQPMTHADEPTKQVMSAIKDTKCTLDEIVAQTGLGRLMVQKIIVSLLFAQYLTDSSYQAISANQASSTLKNTLSASHHREPASVGSDTTLNEDEQASLGFLARLHRKLKGE